MKLIVARNAIAHPTRPLDVDLPTIEGHSAAFMDPFFIVTDRSARAATSDLFPLLSAPFIRMFGLRGAYILPAIGFLLFIIGIPWLGLALDPGRAPANVMAMAAAGTPALFYGLEFWEHALAVGIAAIATSVLVDTRIRPVRSALCSGMLFGAALMLRPEALLYIAAVLLGLPLLRRSSVATDCLLVITGLALVCSPLWVYAALHSGAIFGIHVSSNMVGLSADWIAVRTAIVRAWFGLRGAVLGFALIASAVVAATFDGRIRLYAHIVVLSLAVVMAVAAVGAVFPVSTLWRVAPVAVCLCFVVTSERRGRRFLIVTALLTVLFVCLAAPNDGGAQWGPRYLLFAFIPIAILGADGLEATIRRFGHWGLGLTVVLVVSSLMIQRSAYRELRNTKRIYERVVNFVEARTSDCQYVLTDLWWLDQVVAALYPSRTFLFVDTDVRAREAFARLSKSNREAVCLVRSPAEPSVAIEDLAATAGYIPVAHYQIPERALSLDRWLPATR